MRIKVMIVFPSVRLMRNNGKKKPYIVIISFCIKINLKFYYTSNCMSHWCMISNYLLPVA